MHNDVWHRHNLHVLGDGPRTLVLAHGLGCDQNTWRHVASHLSRDYRVVLFDNMGAGRADTSQWSPRRYATLNAYAEDVVNICANLPWQKVTFVGHSIAGSIGILAGIMAPQYFEKMILLGPSPRFLNDPPDYHGGFELNDILGMLDLMERNHRGWAQYLANMVMQNDDRPQLAKDLADSMCSGDPAILLHYAEVAFKQDIRAELPKLTVPTSILQCANDLLADQQIGEYMHQQLRHSRLRLMRATGHMPHLSYPEETIDLIREEMAWIPTSS